MRLTFIVLVVLCAFGSTGLLAQSDFRSGYVILANGDSLSGKVAYSHSPKSPTLCRFRPNDQNKTILYHASDIKVFGFYFDRRYETKKMPGETSEGALAFVQIIAKGNLSLLKHNGSLYLLMPDGKIIKLLRQSESVAGETYNSILNNILKECSLDASTTPYDETKISYLVRNFNQCHYLPTTFYKPKEQVHQLNYQIYVGIQKNNDLSKSLSPVVGVSADLLLPKFSSNFFISVECQFSKQHLQYYERKLTSSYTEHYDYTINNTLIKFPLGVRYNFLDEYHTPYIKGGMIYGMNLSGTIETIRDQESDTEVFTTFSKAPFDDSQIGLFGAVGYTQGVGNSFNGFVEVRMEKMQIGKYQNTSIGLFIGLRF